MPANFNRLPTATSSIMHFSVGQCCFSDAARKTTWHQPPPALNRRQFVHAGAPPFPACSARRARTKWVSLPANQAISSKARHGAACADLSIALSTTPQILVEPWQPMLGCEPAVAGRGHNGPGCDRPCQNQAADPAIFRQQLRTSPRTMQCACAASRCTVRAIHTLAHLCHFSALFVNIR